MIKRYLQICEKDVRYIVFGLIAGCTASYYSVYVNENTSRIMQGDFTQKRLLMLLKTSLITILATSLRGACFTYSQKYMNHRLRCLIYKKLLHQYPLFYLKTPVSTLLERVTHDVHIVSDIISLNINVISRTVVSLVITIWLLVNISYKLTVIAFIMILFNFVISSIYDKLHKYIMIGFDDANKLYNTYVHETISHISIVKTYATEILSQKQQEYLSNEISKYYHKESKLYAINAFIVFNMPTITTIVVILSANYLQIKDGLITFIMHNQTIYETIKTIIDFKNQFVRCKEPYNRIIDLLDSKEPLPGYYIPTNIINGNIRFDNVVFKYENATETILNNFSFDIRSGDKIAIIGPSGCGKSTIAKLLIGIITPQEGSIQIDNIDIQHYDNKWLKNRIGYVSQDSVLFSDTIANNIAYGLDDYTEEDIINAAKMANAHEFICKLPNKYQTKLEGTELSSLSGGQRQRISIARALVRKPQIIIFDEATSALDPYCEEIVQNTIKECFHNQNSTMIIIAHRKSALDIADKVYKLEDSCLIRCS